MSGYEDLFSGKKVTLLGLGVLGRGAGDAEFIARHAKELVVTDKKTEAELVEPIARLSRYPNITFHVGGHDEKDFTDTDMVIKAAGVRLDSPEIAAAREAGVPIYMSTALFAKFAREAGATIVGVTGTRGKSTVSHLIFHALQKAGKRACLGGNIRGVSTLAMLPEIKSGDICVLELDSWQLQGFGDLKISPQVAVFTNLMPDHQNYYPDMETYFADKANIFQYQEKGDVIIAGKAVAEKIPKAEIPPELPAEWQLGIVGEHNRENAAAAAAALRALGLSEEDIRAGLETFEPVEGRLQFVRESSGVKIYNDNNATTPEATIAAINSFPPGKVVLVAGGADKGLDLRALASLVGNRCKSVYLLSGTGTDVLKKHLIAPVFDSLEKAVHAALDASVAEDILLFSPGFASFGMFKNEYDRNDQFLDIVRAL